VDVVTGCGPCFGRVLGHDLMRDALSLIVICVFEPISQKAWLVSIASEGASFYSLSISFTFSRGLSD
jgi:hypothetical protein